MRNAVSKQFLSDKSFGSTPGRMAVSALVQKTVAMDQLHIERRAGGLFDCDATGCYDRILSPLALVYLQALGLHRSIRTFLARLMYPAKDMLRLAAEYLWRASVLKGIKYLMVLVKEMGMVRQCGYHT